MRTIHSKVQTRVVSAGEKVQVRIHGLIYSQVADGPPSRLYVRSCASFTWNENILKDLISLVARAAATAAARKDR